MIIYWSSNLGGFKRRHAYLGGGLLLLSMSVAVPVAAPAAPPADDDTDWTFTTYTTCRDGATIRPAIFEVDHAVDSMRNADWQGNERLAPDRYFVNCNRDARGDTDGYGHRFIVFSKRAGEAFAIEAMQVDVSHSAPDAQPRAADTTSRTSCRDGATLAVPTYRCMHAADSMRNADLVQSSTDQQRYRARLNLLDNTSGHVHRLLIGDDTRAGNAGGIEAITLDVVQITDVERRERAQSL